MLVVVRGDRSLRAQASAPRDLLVPSALPESDGYLTVADADLDSVPELWWAADGVWRVRLDAGEPQVPVRVTDVMAERVQVADLTGDAAPDVLVHTGTRHELLVNDGGGRFGLPIPVPELVATFELDGAPPAEVLATYRTELQVRGAAFQGALLASFVGARPEGWLSAGDAGFVLHDSDGSWWVENQARCASRDRDRDGATDAVELHLGTSPNLDDTDQDGLLDGEEVDTNPMDADSDGDGRIDGQDPCPDDPELGDRDHDGCSDGRDRCPDLYDPDQADGDGDGAGDACDPCPGLGTGAGFEVVTVAHLPGGSSGSLAVGDVDGDGPAEVVAAVDGVAWVTGVSGARPYLGGPAESVALGDTDADGALDLVARGGQGLYVSPGDGRGKFGLPKVLETDSGGGPVRALNGFGDGGMVVVACGTSGSVWSPTPRGWRRWSVDCSDAAVASVDDGGTVLVLVGPFGTAVVRELGGATFLVDPEPAGSIDVADLDGDGDDDLVVGVLGRFIHVMRVFRVLEGISGTFRILDEVAAPGSAVAPADVDRDGDLDLVTGSFTGWVEQVDPRMFGVWSSLVGDQPDDAPPRWLPVDFAGGDADGDGDVDLFAITPEGTAMVLANDLSCDDDDPVGVGPTSTRDGHGPRGCGCTHPGVDPTLAALLLALVGLRRGVCCGAGVSPPPARDHPRTRRG
jgi:uncharacterized protein (TIGR03382 family)